MDVDLERADVAAMWTQWSRFPGAVVRRVGGLHVFAAPGAPWLTQVCGLGFDGGVDDLEEALALAPGARVTVVGGGVPRVLEELGHAPVVRLVRMWAPARPPRRGDLRVEVVGPEQADLVAAVAAVASGLDLPAWWTGPLGAPGWTQVVAYDGDRAIATGGLHVADGRAYVGAAATVPDARGRGAQTAMLAARLRIAAELGAARVTVKVESGSASHRNLRRAGFVDAYDVTQWDPG